MELTIELSELSDQDQSALMEIFPTAEIYHTAGVIGGDPFFTVVIPNVTAGLPGIILTLATLLEKWQQLAIQSGVQITADYKCVQLTIQGMSANQIHKALEAKFAEIGQLRK